MSNSTRNIIIFLAAIAALIAGIIVVTRIDTDVTEENSPDEKSYTIITDSVSELLSVEVKSDGVNIKAVNNGGEWSIDAARGETDPDKTLSLAAAAAELTSSHLIEENPSDIAKYGLDNPFLRVTVTRADNSADTLLIGDKSPTIGEYFLMKDGTNTVYTINDFKVTAFLQPLSYYREFDRFSVNIDDITDIKLERSDEKIEIKIIDNIDKNTNNVWEMTSPYVCGANDDYIDEKLLDPISKISLRIPAEDGEDMFDASSAILTLTVKPYDSLSGEYGEEYTEVIIIGKTEGDAAYVKYRNEIFKTAAENVAFIKESSFNIVSKLQALVDISKVERVTLEYDGKKHAIDITRSDSGEEFKLDGVSADSEASRKIYSEIIGIPVDGKYSGESLGDLVLRITYEGLKNEDDTIVEFRVINNLNCALTRNGETNFTLKTGKITEFTDLFDEYVKQEGGN